MFNFNIGKKKKNNDNFELTKNMRMFLSFLDKIDWEKIENYIQNSEIEFELKNENLIEQNNEDTILIENIDNVVNVMVDEFPNNMVGDVLMHWNRIKANKEDGIYLLKLIALKNALAGIDEDVLKKFIKKLDMRDL